MTYQDPDPLRDRDLDRNARIEREQGSKAVGASNAKWGWIAGAVVVVLMLVFLFGGTADNTNTASTQPNATAPVVNTPPANNMANAPRGTTTPPAPAETTGQNPSPAPSPSPSSPQ